MNSLVLERALPFKYKLLIGEIVKPHQTSLPGLLGLPPTILLLLLLYHIYSFLLCHFVEMQGKNNRIVEYNLREE